MVLHRVGHDELDLDAFAAQAALFDQPAKAKRASLRGLLSMDLAGGIEEDHVALERTENQCGDASHRQEHETGQRQSFLSNLHVSVILRRRRTRGAGRHGVRVAIDAPAVPPQGQTSGRPPGRPPPGTDHGHHRPTRMSRSSWSPHHPSHPGGVSFALKNQCARSHEDHRKGIGPAGQPHQQHAVEHDIGHLRRGRHAHRRALMQGVPPADRKVDHWHVHRTGQGQEGPGLVGPPRIVDCVDQCEGSPGTGATG